MKPQREYAGITFRALLIGILCAAGECLIAPYNDYVIRNVFLAGGHFPVGPFVVLVLLVLGVNNLLRGISPKRALSSQELVTIWCIMIAAAGIPSTGMMRHALRPMVAYSYYATPENDWQALFHHHIPSWRVVQDTYAIRTFHEGLYSGEAIPWGPWLVPLTAWGIYVLLLYFTVMCLSALLRKQWVEIERCTFPLVQLPVEMSQQPSGATSPFFKNGKLWIGFAIPMLIHALNGLHAYFPAVPDLPIRYWMDPHLVGRPWSALRPLQITLFWSMVGFSYLLSLEVSFSLWFFFWFFKLQSFIGSALGFHLSKGPGVQWTAYSFSASQEVGASLVFVLITLWRARHHIARMARSAFGRVSAASEEPAEAMPYGLILFGLVGGILLLTFSNHLMGMSFGFALLFVLVLLAIYTVLTWQVIQGGIPFVNPSYSSHYILFTTMGSARIDPSSLTALFMHPVSLTRDLREIMMPNVLNGLKASDEVRVKRNHLLWAMGLAMLVGLVVSYYSAIRVSYAYRAPYTGGAGDMGWLTSLLVGGETGTDWVNTGFMIFGATAMGALMWVRRLFVWWPIHPIGFTMWSAWGTFKLWFSIFLGWSIKYSLVRFGGLRAYRQARPVFLGLVLGEMVAAGLWAILGMAIGESTGYRILLD